MSFETGLSGLNAASRNLDVIGSIANANTTGMKASRTEFCGYRRFIHWCGRWQLNGIGVAVGTVSQMFSQGI